MKSCCWTKVRLKRQNIKRVKGVRPTVTLWGEKESHFEYSQFEKTPVNLKLLLASQKL